KLTWLEMSLIAFLIALFLWWLYPTEVAKTNDIIVVQKKGYNIFPSISIEAKSAYVLEVRTGKILFEKEPELQWPLASLTKLMVAFTASKLVPDYMLVRITSDDVGEEGDTGLFPGEEWNIKKLIDYSLVVSSNDGIRAIASIAGSQIASLSATTSVDALFVERMNILAREIGLTETYFLNHSGIDVSGTLSGGYGSAKDVALLTAQILKTNSHILEATAFSKINIGSKNKIHDAVNTNKSLEKIPNVLASKTGYTELSGGNVMLAFNTGLDQPIIISILGSSYEGRFNDLNTIVKATLEYFAK
ncbi:MAG: hypothetical protein AAB484_02825, partial [Patescibacteria group bacterium]